MATIKGTNNSETKYGTSTADTIYGYGGNDKLYGRAGNDTLDGGTGNDGLYGEDGNDVITGGDGVDALFGAAGINTLRGGNGDDYLDAGTGNDSLHGDAGRDRLRGGDGIDALFGGTEDDDLDGGAGDDYVSGGSGNDKLTGGVGIDRLRGDDGNDTLTGDGNDNLLGGTGNDTLIFKERSSGPYDAPEPDPSAGVYDGGTGYDVLVLDIRGVFGQDWAEEIYVTASSIGTGGSIGVVGDHMEPSGFWFARTLNFEEIRVAPGANSAYLDIVGNMKAVGGDSADTLDGWIGNQHFIGGVGNDSFHFAHRVGTNQGQDKITGFEKGKDNIAWNDEDYSGEDAYLRHVTKAVEKNGHTIYTTTDSKTGQTLHVLDVDAVGLPEPGYYLYG